MGFKLQVRLPGPFVYQSDRPRHRSDESPSLLGWLFATLFVLAFAWVLATSLVRWWLRDWHWAWSTPIVIAVVTIITVIATADTEE